jgi:hypothetical protein
MSRNNRHEPTNYTPDRIWYDEYKKLGPAERGTFMHRTIEDELAVGKDLDTALAALTSRLSPIEPEKVLTENNPLGVCEWYWWPDAP